MHVACRYAVDTTVLVKEGKLKDVDWEPLSVGTLKQVGPSRHVVVLGLVGCICNVRVLRRTVPDLVLTCLCCSTTACNWCSGSSIPPGSLSH